MSLTKAKGNMYPWLTHTHSHLAGECPHECSYCYVQAMANHYPNMKEKYSGPVRLIEKEFNVKYGSGKTIFIEHCIDLFAQGVPDDFIRRILAHCGTWPENTYVFQTKNPWRYFNDTFIYPSNAILGCTIETNRYIPDISAAPPPEHRQIAMEKIMGRKFITIEPVLNFDVDVLASWMNQIRPDFVNIGADSKGHNLPEPSIEKVIALVEKLKGYGIEVREKRNLDRLRKEYPR